MESFCAALGCLLMLWCQAVANAEPLTAVVNGPSGKQVTIDVDSFPVRSSNFGVLVHQEVGKFRSHTPSDSRVYLGTVRDYPGAVVAALRKPSGSVLSRISFENGTIWDSTGGVAMVSDPSWKPDWPTTVFPPFTFNSTISVAEVGVDVSYASFVASGSTVDAAVDIVEYSVVAANSIYLRDASILHRIGKIVIRAASELDPYSSTDTQVLVYKLMELWNGQLSSVVKSSHHLAVVSRMGAAGGLAFVGTVGTSSNRYASSGADSNGEFYGIWRHEAGHNWGSYHSEGGGTPEGPTVMSGNKLARFSSPELLKILTHKATLPQLADPSIKISRPPRANTDIYTILDTQPLTLDVLANDLDANFPALKLLSASSPTRMGGTTLRIFQDARERVVYAPSVASMLSGDSFSYRIENDQKKPTTGYVVFRPLVTGWWKMDETSGSTVTDSSTNGATGVITGSAKWDQGLVFGGATTVALETKPSLSGKTPFTLSVWIRVSSASKAVIIQQRMKATSTTNGYDGEYQLYLADGGRPTFLVYGDSAYQFDFYADASVNDGRWHHIVAVRAATGGFIYIDGRLSAAATGDAKNLDGRIAVFMGGDGRDDKDYFVGTLSSVRIYSRALSPWEILHLSNFPEALVGLWRMDEKSGSSVSDSSGNGATGTIIQSATWDASGGLIFQGAGKVSLGGLPSLAGKVSFSIHLWIKVPTNAPTSVGTIIQQRSQPNSITNGFYGEYALTLKEGSRVNFMLYGEGDVQFDFSSPTPINDGKWHHIIAVREGGEGRIYIDGVLSASASGTARSLDGYIDVFVGWDERDNNNFLTATLKDVRIYKWVVLSGAPPRTVLDSSTASAGGLTNFNALQTS